MMQFSNCETLQTCQQVRLTMILREDLQLSLGSLLLPLLLPILQFGVVFRLWAHHGVNVTRDHCSNSCWDTNFKAGYETGAGIYKHVGLGRQDKFSPFSSKK